MNKKEKKIAEAEAIVAKRSIVKQLKQKMDADNITVTELARRMKTSRTTVHRLLDETDISLTTKTLSSAAIALGLQLSVRIVNDDPPLTYRANISPLIAS